MRLPFLRFFKKGKAPQGGVAVVSQPIVAIEKPASERFGKTVMPNVSRVLGTEPGREFEGHELAGVGMGLSASSSAAIPSPVAPAAPGFASRVAGASAPRKISLGNLSALRASVPENAPPVERTISLALADIAPQLPEGALKPGPVDPCRLVNLKASAVERGMASGRPVIRLSAIYQQAQEFFARPVEATDETEIPLPFGKVLEQFTAFQLRADQVREDAFPQMETPFLQVTREDSERFGAPPAPVAAPAAPEPTLAPEPEPAPGVTAEPIPPIRLAIPKPGAEAAAPPARLDPPPARPATTAKVSPNGMGVPASERVPASSRPPVPTQLPSPPAPPPATRIPFKVTAPSNDLRKSAPVPQLSAAAPTPPSIPKVKLPSAPRVRAAEAPRALSPAPVVSLGGPRLQLPLRSVLRGIAPVQLSGPRDEVPETAQIDLPFSIVAQQLSLGKISLTPAQFEAALPEEFRGKFKLFDNETPIPLPLQEVLQHLPNDSLELRHDQLAAEVPIQFDTPFSQKAAEDAERLKASAAPVEKSAPAGDALAGAAANRSVPPPSKRIISKEATGVEITPPSSTGAAAETAASTPARSALQVEFETDDALDPKAIVKRASKLPGVQACAIVFSDGLSLAGNIPTEYEVDALCAMAPSIMKRTSEQMVGVKLGPLDGLTLFCAKAAVTFFAQGNICLAALQKNGEELAPDSRARLSRIVQALARTYTQPQPA